MSINTIGHITHAPVLLSVGPEAAVALSAGVAHLPQVALVALEARRGHAEAGAGVGAPLGPRAGGGAGVARTSSPDNRCSVK